MDRRKFLLNSAALAAGAMTHEFAHAVQQGSAQIEPAIVPPLVGATTESNRTPFTWETSGLVFSFEFDEDRLRFRHVLPAGVAEPARLPAPNVISSLETSIHCTGEDIPDHHGAKLCGGSPGIRMRFAGREERATAKGRRLVITHQDALLGLRVDSIYESFHGISVVRRTANVTNFSNKPVGIEYVSSAMLNNFASPDTFQQDLWIHFAHNSWQAEAQWRSLRPADAGLLDNGNFTVSGVLFSALGSWPCQSYLPMAMVENERCKVIWFWQVEHNGAWHCEIAQTSVRTLYAYLGGPDAQHAQAWKMLHPGEIYKTVPVAIGCVRGGFEQAVAELTRYRRAILLHPRRDMRECPVVFNDAVVLGGDLTTEKEIPLIDAASAAGCEVFCLDAGWSSRPGENWWGAVGDWEPNRDRFPGGFKALLKYIRKKGMTPGLWIEPEVASPQSNIAKASDAWFFMRHGRRVIDHSRYHLDFRNREVRAYIDRIFDRLVGSYGIGYIKLDYNINAFEGTETGAESFGQGLLGHSRAFLDWMDALLERYPDLTIETVASGSMRMEYSMLARAQLQSISDQGDFRMYSSLATGCSAAVLPEQMGVWSQPARDATPDTASCNLVNAMLGRIHQSSYLAELPPESLAQVHQGIAVYKQQIRPHIPTFIPFYPLGMADLTTPTKPAALGMRSRERTFVAVWRREGPETVHLPWSFGQPSVLYPADLGIEVEQSPDSIALRIPRQNMGCIVTNTISTDAHLTSSEREE